MKSNWVALVAWTAVVQNVLAPTLHRTWEHGLTAQWTLACSCWLRPNTLVAAEVFLQNRLFAVLMELICTSILALIYQMLMHLLNFDDLVTFPASQQHGTFFPVMDVDRLWVERWVMSVAETANLFIVQLRFRLSLHRFFPLLLLWLLPFCTTRVNVGWHLHLWLLLLLWHGSWHYVVFR